MPSAWPFRPPSTWQQVPVKPVIRSEVEDGYPKTRRRYTKVWYQYQTNFRLHWNDYDAFWTFWRVDCQGGASPFNIQHPITNETVLVRFAAEPEVSSSVDIKPWFDVSMRLDLQFA